MATPPRLHPVYSSINRPLTIGGAERRLFFVGVVAGGATFTLFGSLFGGLLMTVALYGGSRWVTQRDPELLRIVLRSATARRRYDPGKLAHITVRRRLQR